MQLSRRIAAMVALVSYLVMGAMLYFTVIPGADGFWPPDFRLLGYDAVSIAGFTGNLSDEARATYGAILQNWDRVFIASFAVWVILTGWRGDWMRYGVAFLAVMYAAIDMAENAAIYRFVVMGDDTPVLINAASSLTMAKFAALYLCGLVLFVHLRRTV